MQIIFLRRVRGGTCRLHLGSLASLVLVTVVAGTVGGAFYVGARLGPQAAAGEPWKEVYAALWSREVAAQRERVDVALQAGAEQMDALAARLAELQARSIRVDAMGRRLVEMARLDDQEFDFSRPPASGGPPPVDEGEPLSPRDFMADLLSLDAALADREPKLAAVEQAMMSRDLAAEVRPEGRPVRSGWRSSNFGYRTDPITGRRSLHQGIDYAGRPGSDVVAVASGVVRWSGRRSGYGNVVDLDHGGGYVTRYAHNKKNLVRVGDVVKKGQTIARMGATGHTTGTHVHFEVLRDGKAVNPLKLIRAAN